jgi:hypothetical protein
MIPLFSIIFLIFSVSMGISPPPEHICLKEFGKREIAWFLK